MADSYRKAGLLPGGEKGTYFQTFDFVDGVDLGPRNSLSTRGAGEVGRTWRLEEEFHPLDFSASGQADGEVVFGGYGIVSTDLGWDDYAGIDVKGKVVLVLRTSPDGVDERSPFSPAMALRTKAARARERGAKAVLFFAGPATRNLRDRLALPGTDAPFGDAGIVAVSVKRAVAEALFATAGKSLEEAQRKIDTARRPASFSLARAKVSLATDVTPRKARTSNVIGVLPGRDVSANTEFVVVGAHYDHLGLGPRGSLDPDPAGKIHPGADDNASGAAALLELARAFSLRRGELRRSLLFVSFGAEELGALGASYFVKHATVAADRIVAMVNLDMVGRLRDRKLDVHGIGTSPVWKPLVQKANRESRLKLSFHDGGFGLSDQTPFIAAGIPVLFLFTGLHAEYHRPEDRAETIDSEGIASITSFLAPVLRAILNDDARPPFVSVAGERSAGPPRPARIF